MFGDRLQCEKIQDPHLTEPVRLVLVNKQDFGEMLGLVAATLQKDGLQFAYHTLENNLTSLTFLSDLNSTELTSTIDMINKAMVKFQKPNVLCDGMV